MKEVDDITLYGVTTVVDVTLKDVTLYDVTTFNKVTTTYGVAAIDDVTL